MDSGVLFVTMALALLRQHWLANNWDSELILAMEVCKAWGNAN